MPLTDARSFDDHIRMAPTDALPDIDDPDTSSITIPVHIDIGRLTVNGESRIIHIELYIYRTKHEAHTWIDAARFDVNQLPQAENTHSPPPQGTSIFVPASPLRLPTFVIVDHVEDEQLLRPIIITIRINEWLPGVHSTLELQLDVTRAHSTRTFITTAPDDIHANYVNAPDLMRILGITTVSSE